jgi:hypothetical protein
MIMDLCSNSVILNREFKNLLRRWISLWWNINLQYHKYSSEDSQHFMCKSYANTIKPNKGMLLIILRCLCIYFVRFALHVLFPLCATVSCLGCSPLMQNSHMQKEVVKHLHQHSMHFGMSFEANVVKFHGLWYIKIWVRMGYALWTLN